ACRYRLASKVQLTPLSIVNAEYIGSVAPLEALDLIVPREAAAGLRLSFRVRSTKNVEAEPAVALAAEDPKLWAQGLKIPELRVNLLGNESDAVSVYEQIFGHTVKIALRWRQADLKWYTKVLPLEDVLEQIGFDEDESLYPIDHRVFRGFDYIRDYFAAPQGFLGFRLKDFGQHLKTVEAAEFELIFVLDDINSRLTTAIEAERFGLHCSQAINLFEKNCDRINLKPNDYEHQIVPERSRYLEFEPHRIVSVNAMRSGETEKFTVHPIYSSPEDQTAYGNALFYSIRRMQRRRTGRENRYGSAHDYMGTDVFLTLTGNEMLVDDGEGMTELSVRALCSNRHLPEHLPVGETGADFILLDHDQLQVKAVTQPSKPREPLITGISDRSQPNYTGENAWRLINMLALNHLGLVANRAGEGARALKDVLSLFADLTDNISERRIRGLRSVSGRPVTRRVRALSGVAAARGLEVTITIEDKAFEGSGAFLMGAVLDRFLAEYVSLNQFTQTVIRTPERNEIMRWPPRLGRRQIL
ncbi:MAG: type VI secretion system baseplate subunit TssF, partial [Pseudomonadota bacterium]